MEGFLRYSWPGNLRQLTNVLKTAAIMASDGAEITTAHLADDFHEELAALMPLAPLPREAAITQTLSSLTDPLHAASESRNRWTTSNMSTAPASPMDNLEQVEITTIRRALDACGGNVSIASKLLNISRNTIYRKLKKQQ
jgi:transcriptional regulator of acetoin/glycerol metabolism